ncbi:MAG: Porin [Massilia sp.]|nr:Porin [Massilia sp.]
MEGGGHAVLNFGSGAYLTAGKVIARPVAHGSANLAVFGSFLRSFSSAEPIASAAKFGIVQTGTFAGREHDAFMVGIADTRYSHQLVRYLGEKRSLNGGADPVSQHEYPNVRARYADNDSLLMGRPLVLRSVQERHRRKNDRQKLRRLFVRRPSDAGVCGASKPARLRAYRRQRRPPWLFRSARCR